MPPVRFNPATISLFRSIDEVKIIDAFKFVKITTISCLEN